MECLLEIMRKEVIRLMKAIRIFFRSIRDAFKSVSRNFSLSLASIICVTITLIIFSLICFWLAFKCQNVDNDCKHLMLWASGFLAGAVGSENDLILGFICIVVCVVVVKTVLHLKETV